MTEPHSAALLFEALAFAAHKHRDQRRKDAEASPYINHPIAVANVLAREGASAAVLCAAVLHDTIEDTETTLAELQSHFGDQIAAIVAEVTDDKSLPKGDRKRLQIENAAHASQDARLVKIADKICNLRDLSQSVPTGWTLDRVQGYFDWAKRVIDALRGTHAGLEAAFDAAYARRPS